MSNLIDDMLKSIKLNRSDLNIEFRIGDNAIGIKSFSIAWYFVNAIIAIVIYTWFFLLTSSLYVLNQ